MLLLINSLSQKRKQTSPLDSFRIRREKKLCEKPFGIWNGLFNVCDSLPIEFAIAREVTNVDWMFVLDLLSQEAFAQTFGHKGPFRKGEQCFAEPRTQDSNDWEKKW